MHGLYRIFVSKFPKFVPVKATAQLHVQFKWRTSDLKDGNLLNVVGDTPIWQA